MGGYESNYLDDIERKNEDEKIEQKVERLDYNSKSTKNEEFNIEEATLAALKIFDKFLILGEDVEDAIKTTIDTRSEIIKKLMQNGKLSDISDELKNKINEYMKIYEHGEEER